MPALELRLRTTCVTCGNPIPLTGAELAIACPTCDAPKTLHGSSFDWVMAAGVTSRTPGENAVVVGEAVPAVVACPACRAPIDDASIASGFAAGVLTCRCGRDVGVRAVPPRLDGARWWTALIGESTREKRAPTTKPVHFACPSCGGALLVDGETRTPACRHCAVRAYLPDDLWRALRPTPRAEPFHLWVDPAWNDEWMRKRRAATKWAICAGVATYGAVIVVGLVISVDEVLGPAIGGGWLLAVIAGAIVHNALRPTSRSPR
jgi:predicted RNA-binding Zn-ribbon protein involved in translation (DUF1610 family)